MAKSARVQARALSPWLRRLVLGGLALQLALALYVLWRAAVLTPYSDELDWIQRWRDLQAHGDWAGYLLKPHNLHRQPWTFGLIALDIQAFGGTNLPLILSAAVSLGVMAWLLAREAGLAAHQTQALPAAALAVMLTLMPGNVLDAATPICADYTHGAVFAVLALVLGEGANRGFGWRRAAALAAAMAAGLGDAVALAVWPAMAIGALRRRDWSWLVALAAAGGGFATLYLAGAGGGEAQAALADPLKGLRLCLSFLALPWARLNMALAWIPGLAVGGLGLAAAVWRGGRYATRCERTAAGFILFSLAAAAMAGLGRAGAPDALDVPLRYAVLMAPLQVGLLMLALPFADTLWRANRRAAEALLATTLVLALAQNLAMAAAAVRASDLTRQEVADFRLRGAAPANTVLVHPDLAHARRVYADLAREGLFRHELHLKPPAPAR